jgi:hypothetical protein
MGASATARRRSIRFTSAPETECLQFEPPPYASVRLHLACYDKIKQKRGATMSKPIKWLKEPTSKDYPAAKIYLSLTLGAAPAAHLVKKLRGTKVRKIPARDLLRASRTPMSEVHVFDWVRQNKDIKKGRPLSPILLICGAHGGELIIADGFHRLCAAFANDQDAVVPFKIV